MARWALEDLTLDDTTIRKGSKVVLLEILEVLKYLVVLRNLRLAPEQHLTYNYDANQHRLKQALIEWDD